jgi:hypothetical protein
MNYFTELAHATNELDERAQLYLNQFDHTSVRDLCALINRKVWEIFRNFGEDYEKIPPKWKNCFEIILDGGMPYLRQNNGSINYALGFSNISAEAHLRNFLEQLEGRETKNLDFPVVARLAITE